MTKEITRNIARWMAVLPGAFLAMLISSFPLHLVLYQTLTGSGVIEPYPEAPERVLSPLVATLTFVWAGSRIAPSRKMETAIALFGLVLLLAGVALTLAVVGFRDGNTGFGLRFGGLPNAAGIAGAFIGLYIAYREKGAAKHSEHPDASR